MYHRISLVDFSKWLETAKTSDVTYDNTSGTKYKQATYWSVKLLINGELKYPPSFKAEMNAKMKPPVKQEDKEAFSNTKFGFAIEDAKFTEKIVEKKVNGQGQTQSVTTCVEIDFGKLLQMYCNLLVDKAREKFPAKLPTPFVQTTIEDKQKGETITLEKPLAWVTMPTEKNTGDYSAVTYKGKITIVNVVGDENTKKAIKKPYTNIKIEDLHKIWPRRACVTCMLRLDNICVTSTAAHIKLSVMNNLEMFVMPIKSSNTFEVDDDEFINKAVDTDNVQSDVFEDKDLTDDLRYT